MSMKNGLEEVLRKANEMQKEMKKAQEQLQDTEVEGNAGGGLVKARMNGANSFTKIIIDDSLLNDPKEMFTEAKEVLEELILNACNSATDKVKHLSQEKLLDLTSQLKLPEGLDGLADLYKEE